MLRYIKIGAYAAIGLTVAGGVGFAIYKITTMKRREQPAANDDPIDVAVRVGNAITDGFKNFSPKDTANAFGDVITGKDPYALAKLSFKNEPRDLVYEKVLQTRDEAARDMKKKAEEASAAFEAAQKAVPQVTFFPTLAMSDKQWVDKSQTLEGRAERRAITKLYSREYRLTATGSGLPTGADPNIYRQELERINRLGREL